MWRSGGKERKKRSGRQDSTEDTTGLPPGWFAVAAFLEFPTDRQNISRIPCPNFGKSRFPGSSQIPFPVKIFGVFLDPAVCYLNPRSRRYLACSAGVFFGRANVLLAKAPCWNSKREENDGARQKRVLMGVPNSQLTTNFSTKYQLTTIFLPILS